MPQSPHNRVAELHNLAALPTPPPLPLTAKEII